MSKTKIFVGLVIIVLIVLGIMWSMQTTSSPTTVVPSPEAAMATVTAPTPTPVGDTSDASIQADMTNVDGQMTQLNSDNASADAGMNDKQISQ